MGTGCLQLTFLIILVLCLVDLESADQSSGISAYRQMLEENRRAQDYQGSRHKRYNGGGSNGRNFSRNNNEPLSGDFLIRFNKVPFIDPFDSERGILPLRDHDYPLRNNNLRILKTKTKCPSVTGLNDYEIKVNVMELIEFDDFLNGFPTHATSDKNSVFWDLFLEVCLVQLERLKDPNAPASVINMPLPDTWDGYNLAMIAEAVHDEYPNYHQAINIDKMLKDGGVIIDNNIIPRRSRAQFLRGPVLLADMNTWALGLIGPHSFAAKYAVGRARPEEIAWAISNGDIPRGSVPRSVLDAMDEIEAHFGPGGLPTATKFTAYDEGSPSHPSWPAMHSAASQTSFWLSVVLDLTPEQLCQARLVDYVVAYARTVAGVHYPDDNIDGLNLGQAVLVKLLPQHLNTEYGSDIDLVAEKVEQMKHDWNDFNPNDPCPFDPEYGTSARVN